EHFVLGVGDLVEEPFEDEARTRCRCEEPLLDLVERGQHHELLLERPREAAAAEVPAVELLQEAECAVLAELAHRLAHEEEQFGCTSAARSADAAPARRPPPRRAEGPPRGTCASRSRRRGASSRSRGAGWRSRPPRRAGRRYRGRRGATRRRPSSSPS